MIHTVPWHVQLRTDSPALVNLENTTNGHYLEETLGKLSIGSSRINVIHVISPLRGLHKEYSPIFLCFPSSTLVDERLSAELSDCHEGCTQIKCVLNPVMAHSSVGIRVKARVVTDTLNKVSSMEFARVPN